MKVLIVHNAYTQAGGEDSVVKAESDLLAQAGIDVKVKYFHNPKSTAKQILYLTAEPFNIYQYFRFKNLLKRTQPSVVHLHNWHYKVSPSIIWAARSMSIPLVITVHNYRLLCPSGTLFAKNQLFLDSLKKRSFLSAIKNKVYHNSYIITALLSLTLQFNKLIRTWSRVDKFIFLNKFMADLHQSSYLHLRNNQISVKPNFVKNDLVDKVTLAEERQGFLFVGRLSVEKGIDTLLEAFVGSDYQLKIVGDGPLTSKVLNSIATAPNIEYLGFQNKKVILDCMSTCEALIFPSVWYEGMPITILEAFSCGTPVIASDIGSLTSLVSDRINGFRFQCNDPKDLHQTLVRWRNLSLEERNLLQQRVHDYYLKIYSEEANLSQLLSIYQEFSKK